MYIIEKKVKRQNKFRMFCILKNNLKNFVTATFIIFTFQVDNISVHKMYDL